MPTPKIIEFWLLSCGTIWLRTILRVPESRGGQCFRERPPRCTDECHDESIIDHIDYLNDYINDHVDDNDRDDYCDEFDIEHGVEHQSFDIDIFIDSFWKSGQHARRPEHESPDDDR